MDRDRCSTKSTQYDLHPSNIQSPTLSSSPVESNSGLELSDAYEQTKDWHREQLEQTLRIRDFYGALKNLQNTLQEHEELCDIYDRMSIDFLTSRPVFLCISCMAYYDSDG